MRILNEKYSLAWLQIATIALFTVIGNLIHFLWYFKNQIIQSRARVETICDSIRSTSEQIYQGPHLLVNASLKSIYTAKENILRTIHSGLILLEQIIVWLIQTYKSTYRCLLGFVINSVLSFIQTIIGPLQKAAEGITSFVTGSPSSGKLGDWTQILSDIQTKIGEWFKLDDQFVQEIIGKPFETLAEQLNTSLGSWQPTQFNENGASLSFLECDSQAMARTLDDIEKYVTDSIMIAIGLLFAVFLVITIGNVFYIRFQHRSIETLKEEYHMECKSMHPTNVSHEKYIWRIYESRWIPWEKRNQFSLRLLRYMSHPMVVYCLLTGIFGLIMSHSAQWLLEKKTTQLYSEFDNQLDIWITNTTSQWKIHALDQFESVNQWIDETETELNSKAFGVIKSTALTLNDTLSSVVEEIRTSIDHVLGGTIFETPAKDVVDCLLLTKVENIESGLTWIFENAYVNLTRIDLPFLQTDPFEQTIKNSIQKHLDFQRDNTIPLDNLQSFCYLLLSLWTLCLLIGICLQCYYFLYKKE